MIRNGEDSAAQREKASFMTSVRLVWVSRTPEMFMVRPRTSRQDLSLSCLPMACMPLVLWRSHVISVQATFSELRDIIGATSTGPLSSHVDCYITGATGAEKVSDYAD